MSVYKGTYAPNRRPVIVTAPDCLVYLNGETSLPSGANPNRRVDIQPFVNSFSMSAGIDGSVGSGSISLHIPAHHMNDLYSGGRLVITTMMEVEVYLKGHFNVGGAPRYYRAFWGVVTSVGESYSSGAHNVTLNCSSMLYWWNIQQINVNPAWLEADQNQQASLNLTGNAFTGMNPFSIMYTLARRVYGDSMNVQNSLVPGQHFRSEPNPPGTRSMQAYWAAKLGRMANTLRMYGPTGHVLEGDVLDYVIDPRGFARTNKGRALKASQDRLYHIFAQGDIDLSSVTPFSKVFQRLGGLEITSNSFQTKLSLANMVKEAIGYEFFMDVTGELVFKPPFYNLDVRPNYPVSWIRDVDVIDWSFAENEPEVTFLEATGFRFANREVGINADVQPHATYVDYRLVQKFGWRPGSFSAEFIGSDDFGGPEALFFHLVDVMDRQNARINSGSVTIPLRPEIRLGYPVYVQGRDAYYYVESISHNFSYGSRCTTTLSLYGRRQKLYASFDRWAEENQEPRPGDIADPGIPASSLYKRPLDPLTGIPEGDRNVIMTYLPSRVLGEQYPEVEAFQDDTEDVEVIRRNLVSLRSQYGMKGDNKYVYMVDPKRDKPHEEGGPVTGIEANSLIDVDEEGREVRVNAVIFPVSDERGYEVVGTYEYGRRVTVSSGGGFVFDKNERDVAAENLLNMEPDTIERGGQVPNIPDAASSMAPSAHAANVNKDSTFQVDPNNYGRLLSEIEPPNVGPTDLMAAVTPFAEGEEKVAHLPATATKPVQKKGDVGIQEHDEVFRSDGGLSFRYSSDVARWRSDVRDIRASMGLSEDTYPDDFVLAFIHLESGGDPYARREEEKGLSQYVGLLQIGHANAADGGHKNTDFMGDARKSIEHFFYYQERYKARTGGDPMKQALLWKNGPSFMTSLNRFEATGASPQEVREWVKNYPPGGESWRGDEYLSRVEAARSVWEAALKPPPDIDANASVEEAREAVNNAVTEAARLVDEAKDPEVEKRINTIGLPDHEADLETELNLFEQKLQENLEAGIEALPPDMVPPRDPAAAPIIKEYLQELYARAFETTRKREEQLRGTTKRMYARSLKDREETPKRDAKVANPLGREEVRRALEDGHTYDDLFDPEGAVERIVRRLMEDDL